MKTWNCVAVAVCVAGISACAPPPKHVALTPDARAGLKEAALVGVAEPAPEFKQAIQKRAFVSYGGGLIGAAVALTATAVSAAVENAASDIDEMPIMQIDTARRVEAEVARAIAEETGAVYSEDVALADTARTFGHHDTGLTALVAAAKGRGMTGAILDVRTLENGIVSSGIRAAGDEEFYLVTKLSARIVDIESGSLLARSVCAEREVIGTLLTYKGQRQKFKAAYDAAVEARATEGDEGVPEETPLPPESYLHSLEDRLVDRCARSLTLNLL